MMKVRPFVGMALMVALSMPAQAGEPTAGQSVSRSLAGPVAAEQFEVAARMRQRLASDTRFIARVAAYHSTNSIRFAGMATGSQLLLIEDYLKAVRDLPWTVAADGSMTIEHWIRRESAAIFELETTAGFLNKVAQGQGLTISALMRSDVLLYRAIRAQVTPASSPQDILTE